MVKIRLARYGRRGMPFYRIVAIDSRKRQKGRYIEILGTYDPIRKDVSIKRESYLKHLSNGAQPTEIVNNLFRNYSKQSNPS